MNKIQLSPSALNLTGPAVTRLATAIKNSSYGVMPTDAVWLDEFGEGFVSPSELTTNRVNTVAKVAAYIKTAEDEITAGRQPTISRDQYLYCGPEGRDICMTVDSFRASMTDDLFERCKKLYARLLLNLQDPKQNQWGGKLHAYGGWAIIPKPMPENNYFFSHLLCQICGFLVFGLGEDHLRSRLVLAADYWPKFKGGMSPEGTGYAVALARLYECAMIWKASTGEEMPGVDRHAAETIECLVHLTTPKRNRIVEIGDQARISTHRLEDPDRFWMLWARAITTDERARQMATWWLDEIPLQQMASPANYRHDLLDRGKVKRAPATTKYFAESIGCYMRRDSWLPGSRYFTITAGANDQSHEQDDQGEVQLYGGGEGLVNSQTCRTRSGVENGADYHNVPRFETDQGIIKQDTKGICSMSETEPNIVVVDCNNAYLPTYGIKHTRTVTRTFDRLNVHDIIIKGNAAKCFSQWNMPALPVITGNVVNAGNLTMIIKLPLNPKITIHDWKFLNAANNPGGGFRVDIEGDGEHEVELFDNSVVYEQIPTDDPSPEIEELRAKVLQLQGIIDEQAIEEAESQRIIAAYKLAEAQSQEVIAGLRNEVALRDESLIKLYERVDAADAALDTTHDNIRAFRDAQQKLFAGVE